jgi:hypothetical protein
MPNNAVPGSLTDCVPAPPLPRLVSIDHSCPGYNDEKKYANTIHRHLEHLHHIFRSSTNPGYYTEPPHQEIFMSTFHLPFRLFLGSVKVCLDCTL